MTLLDMLALKRCTRCSVCSLRSIAGIIHSVERPEDEHYKHLVSDLAVSYMRRPGVVIVATITCKEDIDTQVSAYGIHSRCRCL